MPTWRGLPAILILTLVAPVARGHYHMLFPAELNAEHDKPVQLTLAWGHPFEHQLFDANRPRRVTVVAPDGGITDLTGSLKPTKLPRPGPKDGPAGAFNIAFTPSIRGDHIVVVDSAPVWIAEEGVFFEDHVKTIVHVATQVSWDRTVGGPLELMPLTRPYGLEPHVALQAQVLANGKPLSGVMAEIERYNADAPKEADLPLDEQITRRVKADPNGVLTCTLHDAGWWAVTAITDGGMRDHDGKPRPMHRRATLWVYVAAKAK
jgi:cobalt/nickel transport protein